MAAEYEGRVGTNPRNRSSGLWYFAHAFDRRPYRGDMYLAKTVGSTVSVQDTAFLGILNQLLVLEDLNTLKT